jgi:hypothetical protein
LLNLDGKQPAGAGLDAAFSSKRCASITGPVANGADVSFAVLRTEIDLYFRLKQQL